MPPKALQAINHAFRCSSISDFVALQVAQRLGDLEHLDDFVAGINEGPIGRMFDILNRVKASSDRSTLAAEVRRQLLTPHNHE